jgi:5-formyltetrahydrofolate cyclo-ligase
MDVKTAKKLPRQEIWAKFESECIARFSLPCFGRIPNFVGSESAAGKVRLLYEWKNARASSIVTSMKIVGVAD